MLTSVPSDTAILVDPGIRGVGIDVSDLVTALRDLGTGQTTVLPGLARHPELLTQAVKASRARKAVVVTAEFERPPISELRMWGEAGGLAPLGIQHVALDILRARRSPAERSAYAARMVRAAAAALEGPNIAKAVRRPVGASLSRRGLLTGRATTWVPVVAVDPLACLGTLRCDRCVQACPEDALQIQDDVPGAPPAVDTSRCQACSGCLDVCPSGALSLEGHDPGTLAQQLRALLQADDGASAPALVISCHSAAEPLHQLGEGRGLPGWLILELDCLGGMGSAWHLAALAAGAPAVQVLPCARCRDRVHLAAGLDFTRSLLTGLGDLAASRRVGVLPPRGSRLRQALMASSGLSPLVNGTAADPIPQPGTIDTAHVAAWAVGQLRAALGIATRERNTQEPSTRERNTQPRVILGPGAPLGVLRATGGCTTCGACVRTCPSGALTLTAGTEFTELVLDPTACSGCGVCAQTCPEDSLNVTKGVNLDLLNAGCVPITSVGAMICPDCGDNVPALPATARLSPLQAELAGRCPRCRQAALVASA